MECTKANRNPPEQGMKPSDRISNFHGNGIAEARVYSCSRILQTNGKRGKKKKQSKTKPQSNRAYEVPRIKEPDYKMENSEEWTV